MTSETSAKTLPPNPEAPSREDLDVDGLDQEGTHPAERAVASSYTHPGAPEADPIHKPDFEPMIEEIERREHPAAGSLRYIDYEKELMLDLPGFGERDPDCGDPIPEARTFCPRCADVTHNPHNCVRYDCPDHAPYAVRRRVAGSADGVGMAPKLYALANYLYGYRERNQRFQHFVVDIPDDYYVESQYQLEALKSIVKTIMGHLGVQGVLVFHPYRHEGEDPGEENLGKWAPLLFQGHEWKDVKGELEFDPHFHIVGVSPEKCPDLSDVGEFHEATGWVIHRITGKDEDDNISIYNERVLTRVLTYCLSHAGVYETEKQRRIAAWYAGPDVNRVHVGEDDARYMAAITNEEAEDTLGIPSPSVECGNKVPNVVSYNTPGQDPEEFTRASEVRSQRAPWESDPIGGPVGPKVGTGSIRDSYNPGGTSSHVEGVGGMASSGSSTSLDGSASSGGSESSSDQDGDGFDWSGMSSAPTGDGNGDGDDVGADPSEQAIPADVDVDELEECGGYCRHISAAGEYLLEPEWRRAAPYADDLEDAYTEYVDVMTRKGLEAHKNPNKLPEERVDAVDTPPD